MIKGDLHFAKWLSLVFIRLISTTTTTNFESKRSDLWEGWLLNLIIPFFRYPGCEVCWKWNPGLKERKLLQTICKTEGFEASFDSQQPERSGKIIEISFVSTQSRKQHHPFKAWFPLDGKYHDHDTKTKRLSPCIRLQLHGAIYCPNSFVLMLRYCVDLKAIRYESTSLNRIVADTSHRVIVA